MSICLRDRYIPPEVKISFWDSDFNRIFDDMQNSKNIRYNFDRPKGWGTTRLLTNLHKIFNHTILFVDNLDIVINLRNSFEDLNKRELIYPCSNYDYIRGKRVEYMLFDSCEVRYINDCISYPGLKGYVSINAY